jgi:Carboxypeptidase regulatory-like domain
LEAKSAWISAGGVVLAAIIGGLFAYHQYVPASSNLSGEVHNNKGQPISGATVIVAQDQDTPQSSYSDENGIFHVVLKRDVQTVRITVTAAGYDPATRDVEPHRTGPEEFVLTPMPVAEKPKAPTPGKAIPPVGKGTIIIGHDNEVNQ